MFADLGWQTGSFRVAGGWGRSVRGFWVASGPGRSIQVLVADLFNKVKQDRKAVEKLARKMFWKLRRE